MKQNEIGSRDNTFDMMKGIAILAMIAGHSSIPEVFHRFIYLWHMPLFFIVSGYFFRVKDFSQVWRSTFRGLLVPYIFTSVILVVVCIVLDFLMGGGANTANERLLKQLTINGLMPNIPYSMSLYSSGPIWFLLALAWIRLFYNQICKLVRNKILETLIVCIVALLPLIAGKKCYLPFYIWQSMCGVVFYHIGYLWKGYNGAVSNRIPIVFSIGALSLIFGFYFLGMDIWGLYFSCWPLNIFAAASITVAFYYLIRHITKFSFGEKIRDYITHIGKYSILVLAIHTIEKCFMVSSSILVFMDSETIVWRICNFILQVSLCLVGLYIVEKSFFVCKVFNIKK